jgi:hypothetical protein
MLYLVPFSEKILLCHAGSTVRQSEGPDSDFACLDRAELPLGLARGLLRNDDAVLGPQAGFEVVSYLSEVHVGRQMVHVRPPEP